MKVVIKSVIDLRRQPFPWDGLIYKDPLQDSQLLLGEQVRVLEQWGDWLLVEALEQDTKSSEGLWRGYPGWILASDVTDAPDSWRPDLLVSSLWAVIYAVPDCDSDPVAEVSLGTKLQSEMHRGNWVCVALPDGTKGWISLDDVLTEPAALGSTEWREQVLELARQFIGSPYFWGGRSGYKERSAMRTGVDCSGLVQLVYRVHGINIPRNAGDQMQRSQAISPNELRPADLVFMNSELGSSRIDHVMLYGGDEWLVEATIRVGHVRAVTFYDKMGISLAQLKKGHTTPSIHVSFGRFI